MIIKLNDEMSQLLLQEVQDASSLVISQKTVGLDMKELEVSDIQELQLLINDEIAYRGLENQDTINDFGKRLYDLYDEVLYQRHNN